MDLSPAELVLILFVSLLSLAVLFIIVYVAIRLAMKNQKQVSFEPVLEPQAQDEPDLAGEPEPRPARTENPPIQHAFDFAEDKLTMILEMPPSLLEDDEALAEGWVHVVSWARVAYREILEGRLAESRAAAAQGESTEAPELSGEALEASLKRLHDAAERRRELRMMLNEKQSS